jgi:hypothetical protein
MNGDIVANVRTWHASDERYCSHCKAVHPPFRAKRTVKVPEASCALCRFWRVGHKVHERRYACGLPRPKSEQQGPSVAAGVYGGRQPGGLRWPDPMVRHDPVKHGPKSFGGSYMCLKCLAEVDSRPIPAMVIETIIDGPTLSASAQQPHFPDRVSPAVSACKRPRAGEKEAASARPTKVAKSVDKSRASPPFPLAGGCPYYCCMHACTPRHVASFESECSLLSPPFRIFSRCTLFDRSTSAPPTTAVRNVKCNVFLTRPSENHLPHV